MESTNRRSGTHQLTMTQRVEFAILARGEVSLNELLWWLSPGIDVTEAVRVAEADDHAKKACGERNGQAVMELERKINTGRRKKIRNAVMSLVRLGRLEKISPARYRIARTDITHDDVVRT